MANNYLNHFLNQFIKATIPRGKSVLILTSKNINAVQISRRKKYDYIIVDRLLEKEKDIFAFLKNINSLLDNDGKIIVIYNNYFFVYINSLLGIFSQQTKQQNWLSSYDISSFLKLTNFDPITQQALCFIPIHIPIFSFLLNYILLYFFPFNHFAKVLYICARKTSKIIDNPTVSIIIPTRNESGTIKKLFTDIPTLGKKDEIVFVEGHSSDDTYSVIQKNIKKYQYQKRKKYVLLRQKANEKGKASAVRIGFKQAKGEILMIYDADMSVHPTELTKFYNLIATKKGDFINGSRLIYPMQGKAMQLLNILGNKFFSILYSWILGQQVKDTLCGTKVLWKKDYEIMNKLHFFAKYDPFGDFDLLIASAKLNLRILDLPVRYYERQYGATNIKRFQNGLELAKYSLIAIRLLKIRQNL